MNVYAHRTHDFTLRANGVRVGGADVDTEDEKKRAQDIKVSKPLRRKKSIFKGL